MRKKLIVPILAIALIVGLCASAMAGGHGHKAPKKVGILLVAFGSSEPSAQVSFENIDKWDIENHPPEPQKKRSRCIDGPWHPSSV